MGKYLSLKIVATVISLVGVFFLAIAIIEFLIIITLTKFNTLEGNEFLETANIFINSFLYFQATGIIVWGIILFIVFQAISQQIRVFIDIEINTNKTHKLLSHQLEVLESIRQFEYEKLNSMLCARCLGKGFVDNYDLPRLGSPSIGAGPCKYCDATGTVKKGATKEHSLLNDFSVADQPVYIPERDQDIETITRYGDTSGLIGLILFTIFLFNLISVLKFEWFPFLIGSGLLLYSFSQEEELFTLSNIPFIIILVAVFLIIGVIFASTFYASTLIFSLLLGGAGIFFLMRNP
jgi:hypothetical protein